MYVGERQEAWLEVQTRYGGGVPIGEGRKERKREASIPNQVGAGQEGCAKFWSRI